MSNLRIHTAIWELWRYKNKRKSRLYNALKTLWLYRSKRDLSGCQAVALHWSTETVSLQLSLKPKYTMNFIINDITRHRNRESPIFVWDYIWDWMTFCSKEKHSPNGEVKKTCELITYATRIIRNCQIKLCCSNMKPHSTHINSKQIYTFVTIYNFFILWRKFTPTDFHCVHFL